MVHTLTVVSTVFLTLVYFTSSKTLYEVLTEYEDLREFYTMVNRDEVLQVLLDRRDATVFAPSNKAIQKAKSRKQDDPKRDEILTMPGFYVLNVVANKSMFPMSISPFLSGVAPLYLSLKDDSGPRKVSILNYSI
ncbi:uncharacterized protein LOC118186914 [Stegodyphus dumicola]|uniref:uncharacterized protein LOC118186914 n=1 Tax=Stegodyphus dumicola TaxID=202533 RepID=UPI0015AB7844|nr:uncharacterized protein LOC118186914 [Stegodyphus dumicola]